MNKRKQLKRLFKDNYQIVSYLPFEANYHIFTRYNAFMNYLYRLVTRFTNSEILYNLNIELVKKDTKKSLSIKDIL